MIFPRAGRGAPRERHIPDLLSMPSEDMLADAKWKKCELAVGDQGQTESTFCRRSRADRRWTTTADQGHGPTASPGEEAWLIGEHRRSGEKKYYLANLPAATDLRTLATTIKARWICEQAHQQLNEEVGLDHFDGRSWQGLHRHALMTTIAYAFLQHRRLAQAGGKTNQRASASAEPAGRTPRHRRTHRSTTTAAMPVDKSAKSSSVNKSAKVVLVHHSAASRAERRMRCRRLRPCAISCGRRTG
ncbi:SRSO17 transposase [Bradyrhizobium sp. AZCC 1588]